MKRIFKDIYFALTVNIPHTRAWKWRKRMQAIEKYQGTITFTRKFFIDDDLPLPAEFA
jgi:hypothetical protein